MDYFYHFVFRRIDSGVGSQSGLFFGGDEEEEEEEIA